MPVSALPVLIASSDLLPHGGPLNGRRSAGQTLLWLWAKQAGANPLTLAVSGPEQREGLYEFSKSAGHTGELNLLDFINPEAIVPHGALFLPDPSIGRWSHWRSLVGSAAFSLIGQIHTLSTPASMTLIEELVTEPVRPWDAVICTSHAGKAVLEAVIDDREQKLLSRLQVDRPKSIDRPQLPVIPLPIGTSQISRDLLSKEIARQKLGIDSNSHVVLWLGRLSMLTKLDPWSTYQVLQAAATQLDKPLVLIECGPDDTSFQAEHFRQIRALCPNVQFCRLGGDKPVSDEIKLDSLAAADLAISLVDNTQETFGLAVAEAMAAGLPVVASDWNGYKDLVRSGIDGFLVPTKWNSLAEELSPRLGWASHLGLLDFPMAAGCLAQLVQLDLSAAVAAIVSILNQPAMRRAMGAAAKIRAEKEFSYEIVMDKYQQLFESLEEKRAEASPTDFAKSSPSVSYDPVNAFAAYPSKEADFLADSNQSLEVPDLVKEARQPLWDQLKRSLPTNRWPQLDREILLKHQLNQ